MPQFKPRSLSNHSSNIQIYSNLLKPPHLLCWIQFNDQQHNQINTLQFSYQNTYNSPPYIPPKDRLYNSTLLRKVFLKLTEDNYIKILHCSLFMQYRIWSLPIIFRWLLIMIGLAMLVSVLFIMGQLLVDWGHGRANGISMNNTTAEDLISTSSSEDLPTTATAL